MPPAIRASYSIEGVDRLMSAYKKLCVGFCVLGLLTLSSVMALSEGGASPARHGQEIIAARTAHSKTYRNDNGTTSILVSSAPLHYLDGNEWQDIDTTLEAAAGEVDPDGQPFGYKTTKNVFTSFLPQNSNGWVELRAGESSLAFKLIGSVSKGFGKKSRDGIQATGVWIIATSSIR